MRRTISLLLVLFTFLSVFGCANKPAELNDETTESVVNDEQDASTKEPQTEPLPDLDFLPDISELNLGKNQGELVPYLGGYKYDEENGYWTEHLYGLMTADGEIVVEAVYTWYQIFELNGEIYYCMKYSEGEYDDTVCYSSLLVKADGTRGVEIADNIVCISENRIIAEQFDAGFTVYDYEGKEIFRGEDNQTIDTDSNGYYNGLLVLHDFISETPNTIVCDENGKTVLDKLDYCGPFETGKAVASYDRDEGFGIISPEGEWLLEPIYSDIKSVNGKYFIAINYDKEEIYDSELKLLRTRDCGIYVTEQSYFFETDDGRLLRYYSHMDSPDSFYRDAFTDEIISYNGINATGYMEYLGLFYNIDETSRAAIVCDEKGNLLSEHKNTDRIEEYDGIYCAVDTQGGTYTYYHGQTHKKLLTLTCGENEWKPVSTVDDCGWLTIGNLEDKMDNRFDGPYHLYSYETGEYAFKDCEYCEINKLGDKIYISVIYKDEINIYDENLKLVLRTDNCLAA